MSWPCTRAVTETVENVKEAVQETVDTVKGSVAGTVVSVSSDGAFVDIGRKMDGVLPPEAAKDLKIGTKVLVSIRGRDDEGNYLLSTIKVEVPKDWFD